MNVPHGNFSVETAKCACGKPCRHDQRNCHVCHAVANRDYRKRLRNRLQELEATVHRLTSDDPVTKAAFDARFWHREVIVRAQRGDSFEDFSAEAVSFKPGLQIQVRDEHNRIYTVPLNRLWPEHGR